MNRLILDPAEYSFTAIAVLGRFDRESGEQKSRDGVPEWTVQTLVQHADGAKPETVEVVIAAEVEPKLAALTPVQFERLVGRPWLYEGRAGVSFRADMVRASNGGKSNGQKPAVESAAVAG
jgi:hypothetical protein